MTTFGLHQAGKRTLTILPNLLTNLQSSLGLGEKLTGFRSETFLHIVMKEPYSNIDWIFVRK